MPIYRKVDKNFFKKWTAEMAYVLGFFAADGYMTVNKRGGHFWNIQITDEKLLNSIKKCIGSDHKISKRTMKGNEKPLYRLQVGSKEMFNDLYALGMRQDKTKSLAIPKIQKLHLGDFVRGYFDGDGNVWTGYVNKKRNTKTLVIQTTFTSCSLVFLTKLKDILNRNEVDNGYLVKGKRNYFRLVFSVRGSLKLYNLMYNRMVDGGKLFLLRKKKVFDKFIKYRLDNAVVV